MKKITILILAGFAVLSTACLNRGAKTKATPSNDEAAVVINDAGAGGTGTDANATAANSPQVQDTIALGKLCFVNGKDGEQPVMTALSLSGNHTGSTEFNSKPCATEGICSVFELNEWVEILPQATVASGIKVMVFPHHADQGFYLENALNDETPGYVQELELNQDPEDATRAWGSFYLHPEEVGAGCYDLVFLHGNRVFAILPTRFFKEGEVSQKTDAELEELMAQRPS